MKRTENRPEETAKMRQTENDPEHIASMIDEIFGETSSAETDENQDDIIDLNALYGEEHDDEYYDDYDDSYDDYDEDDGRRPKKKRRRKRRVALWKKILLTLEFMILAAIILAAIFLVQSGVFEESAVVFGELAVDGLYYVAGQGETAVFTIRATGSEKEMQLCDAEENAVGSFSDDGRNGDETAGDGIYTCSLTIADTDAGAQTYHVREVKTTSSEVTIYIFRTLDAEELESAGEVCDEVRAALKEIETGYAGASGYVATEDYSELFAEVERYLENLTEDGTVIRYVVEDESAYIKFSSGLSLCYAPVLEDTFSGEDDVQLTVTCMQPAAGSYAAECEEMLENVAAQVENLESGETLEGSEVTLSAVKSLAPDQVIVWYGHGTYSTVTGSGLVLDITVEDFTSDLTTEDQSDLFQDRLTTVYPEDGEQHLAVTAAYVEKYCGDLSNDLIFLSACDSGKDARLSEAFLGCGATAVLSFSDSVLCEYASGVIDGVLQYMLRAWPGSEWLYTLEQALERVENELGENDAAWFEKYADTLEEFQDAAPCGAEPVLLTREAADTEAGGGAESGGGTEADGGTEGEDGTEADGGAEGEDGTEADGGTKGKDETGGDGETAADSESGAGGIRLSTEKGTLSGTVGFYGDPAEIVAGATVTISQAGDLYMELVTDENGEYEVGAIPVGTYDIVFSLAGYGDYYQENVVVNRDETTNADGYFFSNSSVAGTVIDALTGDPLADVEVELLIGDGETIYKQTVQTDENGNYTFDLTEESKSAALSELTKYFNSSDYSNLLEGSTVMTEKQLSPENISGYTMGISGSGVILFEKDGYVDQTVEITLTGFESPDVGTTELTPQVEIGGYVYDANGNALGGVIISAVMTDDGSAAEQGETDESEGSDEDGDEDNFDSEDGSGESESETVEDTASLSGTSNPGGTVEAAGNTSGTVSTAAIGDTIETETDVDGYYSLGFDMGSKITIRVTYSLSGYDTKTVEYEIDSSMIADGKVQLAGVSLTRTKQAEEGMTDEANEEETTDAVSEEE